MSKIPTFRARLVKNLSDFSVGKILGDLNRDKLEMADHQGSSEKIIGYLDHWSPTSISGWAAREKSADPIEVELVVDGNRISSVVADIYREDLRSANIGSGMHGFRFVVPSSMFDDQEHSVIVRDSSTRTALGNSPKIVRFTRPTSSENVGLRGYIDLVHGTFITGWATQSSGVPPRLYLSIDGTITQELFPSSSRLDVAKELTTDPSNLGFTADISSALSVVRAIDSSRRSNVVAITFDVHGKHHLGNSPQTIHSSSDTAKILLQQGRFVELMGEIPRDFIEKASQFEIGLSIVGISATLFPVKSDEMSTRQGRSHEPPRFELRPDALRPDALECVIAAAMESEESILATLSCATDSGVYSFDVPVDRMESLDFELSVIASQERARFDAISPALAQSIALIVVRKIASRRFANLRLLVGTICTYAIQHRDERTIDVLVNGIFVAAWNARLWGLCAQIAEQIVSIDVFGSHPGRNIDLEHRLEFLTRSYRLAVSFPDRFARPVEARDSLAASLLQLDERRDGFEKIHSNDILGKEWFSTIIAPSINDLATRPELCYSLIVLDLRSAIYRITQGKARSITSLSVATPWAEGVFLYLESLVDECKQILDVRVRNVFQTALLRALEPCELVAELTRSLCDDSGRMLRFSTEVEQHFADFLVFSSKRRRCDHSRIQSLYFLSRAVDTWRPIYEQVVRQRAGLYSFKTPLRGTPSVSMSYSHERLQEALYQLSDDISALIDSEGDDAFYTPEMIIFDSINLGHTSRLGDVALSIANDLGRQEKRAILTFAPWLTLGGADAYCCTLANALSADASVVLCLTEQAWTEGAGRLDPRIKVVDLSARLRDLSDDDSSYCLAMAIELTNPRLVFNFNSRRLWTCLRKYHCRLARVRKFVNLFFCDDIDRHAKLHSYLRLNSSIFRSPNVLAMGDSGDYFVGVCRSLSIDSKQCLVAHFPPLMSAQFAAVKRDYSYHGRVLWSGRFDTQKRLDLLLSIARSLPMIAFDIFGFPMLETDPSIVSDLTTLSNVAIKGRYTSFAEVDVDQYDCLLMTTQWEGAPNIVLESGVRGLPIVAPSVGGLRELIGDGRGYLVGQCDDADDYVDATVLCLEGRKEACIRAEELARYITTTHSSESLRELVETLGGLR